MLCNRHKIVLADILRTCDYLYKLALSDIYLTDKHVVGIGVTNYLLHLSHNYI